MSEATPSIANRAGADAPYPAPAVGWYATVVLAFLYWLSLLDRYIISLLVDPIKRDLGLTDVQFGMLHGVAFMLTFTVFGLVFGALADRVNRRRIIYIGVCVWSIATACCGLAQNFWHMLLARVGVGAGEAALNPCATSMIADLFPREKLTTAMAVYFLGATIGSGTAFIVGGAIVDVFSNMKEIAVPLLGQLRPWQAVFFIVGLPGTVLAFTIFAVPEPVRRGTLAVGQTARSWQGAYVDLWKFIKSRPRFFACHYAGFTISSALVVGNVAWYPVHMGRSFGWSAGRIGLLFGMTFMAAGIIGKVVCARIMDAMYKRGYRDAQMRWYAACLLVGTPIGIFATTSGNPWVFLSAIFVFSLLITAWPACAMTALNLVTPNQLRGTGIAVFTTITSTLGGSVGAVAIPAFSQHFFGGGATIGFGIAILIAICCPLSAVILWLGLPAMRAAMTDAERTLSPSPPSSPTAKP